MPIIAVRDNENTPRGAFGRYFSLSEGKGVKVLHSGYATREAALRSGEYNSAMEEAIVLQTLNDSCITPKCFGVEIIEIVTDNGGKTYSPGIVLEHLGATNVQSAISKNLLSEDEYARVHEKNIRMALSNEGIEHCDMHRGNVMYHNGRCYVIDFSPGHYRRVEKKHPGV